MGEVITVKIGQHHKWQKILLYIQNSPNAVFTMKFDDYNKARAMMMRLNRSIAYRPTWYNLIIIQRKCNLYIIKPDKAQKVVVLDG